MSNEDLTKICNDYFEGCKPKHLSIFEDTTPKGNVIEGYICRKPNKYLGSLLITSVNGESTEQFVQSMPKIHYFKDSRDIPINNNGSNCFPCYEKLDGSCLILYPLKNSYGDIIEIVPKTRGRAIADKNFRNYFEKIDYKPITNYYSENDGTLIFELYGVLNQHMIHNYDTYIDIRLIGIYEYGEHITGYGEHIKGFVNDERIVIHYGFKLPDKVFTIKYVPHLEDKWMLTFTSKKYSHYLPSKPVFYPTNNDLVLGIKEYLEKLNTDYKEINNRIASEGVVINTYHEDVGLKWLKCKPDDIEKEHKSYNGVPRKAITKEVLKYFDEYGANVKELYITNPQHYMEYITRMLSEEYDDALISKSRKRIERIFLQIWEGRELPKSLQNICNELIENYQDKSLPELMSIFAQEYPQKKKDARKLYTVLKARLNKEKRDEK